MKSKAPYRRSGLTRSDRVQRALENLFLLLTAVYMFFYFTSETTLSLAWPEWFEHDLLLVMWLTALARLLYIGPKRAISWLALGATALYQLIYRADGYSFLLFMGAMTVGLADIDYRAIIRTHLLAAFTALLCAVGAAFSNAITNLVYFRDGLRSSWGVCYTSDFSTFWLFMLIMLWVVWEKAPDWVMLPISLSSACLALFVTHSRNSLVCSLLFTAVIGWHWLETGVLLRRGPRPVIRGVNALLVSSYALAFGFTWLLVFLYSRNLPLLDRVNTMLSDRLRLCLDAYRTYGLTPFGAPIKMVGSGFSTITREGYNYVDMSFFQLPLRYGVVLLVTYGAAWTWMVIRAIRNGHRRLALAMGVIAFHSIVEQHISDINASALVLMPLAGYAASPAPEAARRVKGAGKKGGGGRREAYIASAATLAVLIAAAALLAPGLLSRLRTVFEYRGWRGGGDKAVPVMLVIGGIALTAAAAGRALYVLACGLIANRRLRPRALIALAVCAAIGVGGYLWLERNIDGAAARYADVMDSEDGAIRSALSSATGKVYAGALPELYRRRYPEFSSTLLPIDDMPRHRGTTALVDLDRERHTFIQCGFRYAQISAEHGIYTDDPAVADALAAAGYDVEDFYYTARHVDLPAEMKKSSALPGENGLLLDGLERTLHHGPYYDLYAGSYEAYYSLLLPESGPELAPDTLVCTLQVYANANSDLLAEASVYREQFDESGRLTVTLPFSSPDAHKLEFQADAGEGVQVWISDISYRMLGH